jgi:hypothetical protein
MTEVRSRVADGRMLKLLRAYLTQGVIAYSGDREQPDRSIVNANIGHREHGDGARRSEATLGC